MRSHYPGWDIEKTIDDIFLEIYEQWMSRLKKT